MLGKCKVKLALAVFLSTAWLAIGACGQVEQTPASTGPAAAARVVATKSELGAPEGSDAAPRIQLERVDANGSTTLLSTAYVDAVEFRDGQAAVTKAGELQLLASDGSRSLVARHIDGLPTRAADGSLVYAARFGQVVEVYSLSAEGAIRRVASFRGSATRLSPQPDGSVVFVGALVGGVSGVWIADSQGVRCLTNCALRAGARWGDVYRAPPGDAASIRVVAGHVRWQTADGDWQSVSIGGEP